MIVSLLFCFCALPSPQATAELPWQFEEFRSHQGAVAEQAMGFYVHTCGDLNGDGVGEYLIASPGAVKGTKHLGGVEVRSGRDGKLLREFFGPHESSNFGRIALSVGDINGDGIADLAIGATKDSTKIEEGGSLSIYSGADGELIHRWFGDEAFDKFGRSLALLEDLDGDNVAEILVGGYQPSGLHAKGRGYVRLYSGKSGKLLRTITGQRPRDMFGVTLAGSGDLTGDKFGDFAVGSFFARLKEAGRQPSHGSVSAFDGKSGELQWRTFASDFMEAASAKNNPTFGRKVCAIGDLNGDGLFDVLASAPLWEPVGNAKNDNRGLVVALSGVDGQPIEGLRAEGFRKGSGLGHSLAQVGDVDGDGHSDWLVGAMAGGFVELRSGSDFSVLARVVGDSPKSMFSQSLRSLSDLDGDGFIEVIIGEPAQRSGKLEKSGRVQIYSIKPSNG